MIDSIVNQFADFFNGTSEGTIELGNSWADLLPRLVFGLVLGFVLSIAYMMSYKKNYSRSFAITTVLLPSMVASVIWLVGSDLTKAISIGGLFTLIKFRSIPGDSKDILNVLLSMAVGLAVGLGFYPVAVLLTIIMVIILVALNKSSYAKKAEADKQLKITVSESLNFEGVFDEVLPAYADSFKLESIKTTHMGTMFELTYSVAMKPEASTKAMIDDLRTRNGNLPIVLNSKMQEKAVTQL